LSQNNRVAYSAGGEQVLTYAFKPPKSIPPLMSKPSNPVRLRYTKSPHHRFVYADGAISRVTGARNIALDFFIGLFDINDEIYEPKKERTVVLPDELPYTREIQATIVLTPDMAAALRDMINDKLKEFEDDDE